MTLLVLLEEVDIDEELVELLLVDDEDVKELEVDGNPTPHPASINIKIKINNNFFTFFTLPIYINKKNTLFKVFNLLYSLHIHL